MSKAKGKNRPKGNVAVGKNSPSTNDKVDGMATIPPRPRVIFDESIEKLRLTEERLQQMLEEIDLQRTAKSLDKPDILPNTSRVVVRKELLESERPKPTKRVVVLKHAPNESNLAGQISTVPFGNATSNPPLKTVTTESIEWHAAGLGPRIRKNGQLVEHSILGDPEHFYHMAVCRGDIPWDVVPADVRDQIKELLDRTNTFFGSNNLPSIPEQPTPGSSPSHIAPSSLLPPCEHKVAPGLMDPNLTDLRTKSFDRLSNGDAAALKNWSLRIAEQKKIQNRLSEAIHRDPAALVMNSGEDFYLVRLEQEKIDRCLPLVSNGKGWRYGSEFWNQSEYLDESHSNDLCTTLNLREQGYYGPLEYVKCPLSVRREKGILGSNRRTTRDRPTSYLKERNEALAPLLTALEPHKPDLDQLEIVGQSALNNLATQNNEIISIKLGQTETDKHKLVSEMQSKTMEGNDEENSDCPYPCGINAWTDLFPDSDCQLGPNLMIQDELLQWSVDLTKNPPKPCDIQIVFQCSDPEKCTEYLQLFNNGTAVIYFEWTRLPEPDTFGLDRSDCRRFFFNFQPGTLQPGEIVRIPVTFQSTREGIFKESWRLDTKPILNGSAPIRIHFHGVSVWPDEYQFQSIRPNAPCTEVEKEATYRMIYRLVNDLITYFEIPQRPPTPEDPMATEFGAFKIHYPNLFFNHDVIQKLKRLYQELRDRQLKQNAEAEESTSPILPEVWNYSIRELRDLLYATEPEKSKTQTQAKREEEFTKFFQLVDTLSFPPPQLPEVRSLKLHQLGYQHLLSGLSELFDECSDLRSYHGLPSLEIAVNKSKRMTKNPQQMGTSVQKLISSKGDSSTTRPIEDENSIDPTELSAPTDTDTDPVGQEFLVEPTPDAWRQKASSIVYSGLIQLVERMVASWEAVP